METSKYWKKLFSGPDPLSSPIATHPLSAFGPQTKLHWLPMNIHTTSAGVMATLPLLFFSPSHTGYKHCLLTYLASKVPVNVTVVVASQCLESAYGISIRDVDASLLYPLPASLQHIFSAGLTQLVCIQMLIIYVTHFPIIIWRRCKYVLHCWEVLCNLFFDLNVPVATSKGMQVVKLCCNEIFQFLTGAPVSLRCRCGNFRSASPVFSPVRNSADSVKALMTNVFKTTAATGLHGISVVQKWNWLFTFMHVWQKTGSQEPVYWYADT